VSLIQGKFTVATICAICMIHSDAIIDYDIALILARIDLLKDRRELLMTRFFKRQVLASNALLHHVLPERRDNDTLCGLRNSQPFPSVRAHTQGRHPMGPLGPGPGPPILRGPKQPMRYFSSREIIVTNCVIFHWLNK